jgi:uncharacterized membrane protein
MKFSMAKKSWLLIRLAICSVACGVGVLSPVAGFAKSWNIPVWNGQYTIDSDAVVHVVQTMEFAFDDTFTFVNIYIPKQFTKDYGRIGIENLHLYDEAGVELTGDAFEVETHVDRVDMTLHFAAYNEHKIFVLKYDVTRAVRLNSGLALDQFAWNVVPEDRDVEILHASAQVILPRAYTNEQVHQYIYVGAYGSTESKNATAVFSGNTFAFEAENILAGENMTITAQWPTGAVTIPPAETVMWVLRVMNVPFTALPFIVFVFLAVWFWRFGRDPHGRGTIIPQYEAPDALAPAHVGGLMHEEVKTSSIVALIIDLAQRGYIKIIEEKRSSLFTPHEYTLVKTGGGKTPLSPVEEQTMHAIFGSDEHQNDSGVKLSQLKRSFPMQVPKIRNMILQELYEAKYFRESPRKTRTKYYILAVSAGILSVVALLTLGVLYESYVIGASLGATAMIFIFAAPLMPQRTMKGVAAVEYAKGFKLYLHHAERFRVRKLTPDLFNSYLPYAMIFGIEREWAHVFEGIVTSSPDWYSSPSGGSALSVVAFTQNLHGGFVHAMSQSTHVSNSSGGGSFSGGGFGGGGISAG